MFRLPMFGFSCLAFLMLLVIVAIATWLVFRSQEPGQTKLSGCAGCAIGFALLLIAGLGALGCTAVALFSAPSEFIRHGPVKRFELHWPDDERRDDRWREPGATSEERGSFGEGERYPARLTLVLRDDAQATEIAGAISRWLRDESGGDLSVHIRTEETEEGPSTRLEFQLPVSRRELEKLRDDLRREFPRLRIPEGVEVDIHDTDD